MSITIYGASDDLIEVEGCIREEFTFCDDVGGDLIACSDGTVLRVRWDQNGVWRISPVALGTARLEIRQAPEDDEEDYSDHATLHGDVSWVVRGHEFASTKGT